MGEIRGVVYDKEEGVPLYAASVIIVGTQLGSATDKDGKFVIRVRPGKYTLQARYVGYESQVKEVEVRSGETVEVNFYLVPITIKFDEVIVTGKYITSIDASELENAPVQNLLQFLQARLPGVNVMPQGGRMGDGSKLMLRGPVSLTMGITPVIYLDGVRIDNFALETINPADIDRVIIIKGAASTTIYGGDAAAGIILIFTKLGSKN
jgi:hypothetical protein